MVFLFSVSYVFLNLDLPIKGIIFTHVENERGRKENCPSEFPHFIPLLALYEVS